MVTEQRELPLGNRLEGNRPVNGKKGKGRLPGVVGAGRGACPRSGEQRKEVCS